MSIITATYSKQHTTGISVWNLDQLGINISDIKDFDIKWDILTISFKDEDLEEEEYSPTSPVSVYDEDNGHEFIKHPESVEANFTIVA
jgi:hypothetical protein